MEVKIEVRNASTVAAKLNDFAGNLSGGEGRVMKALVLLALDLRNEMIHSMQHSLRTGRHYRRRKGDRRGKFDHIASSPGNPPRPDTGELLRSIIMEARPSDLAVEVGSNITKPPYPAYLEEGTGRVAPRPFLAPAMDKLRSKIERRILDAVAGAIR
ncbi:MAG: hypothetical protein C4575_09280 [Desulforudis sp.]|nr:MAG: hypothetical protein C4575_09280 [Desulforudis sp.]